MHHDKYTVRLNQSKSCEANAAEKKSKNPAEKKTRKTTWNPSEKRESKKQNKLNE